jgi:hypothetical protein
MISYKSFFGINTFELIEERISCIHWIEC